MSSGGNAKMRRVRALLMEEQRLLSMQKQSVDLLTNIVQLRNMLQIEKLDLQNTLLNLRRKQAENNAGKLSTEEKDRLAMPPPPPPEAPTVNDEKYCNQREVDLSITNKLSSILNVTFDDVEESDDEEESANHDFFAFGERQQSADVQ